MSSRDRLIAALGGSLTLGSGSCQAMNLGGKYSLVVGIVGILLTMGGGFCSLYSKPLLGSAQPESPKP